MHEFDEVYQIVYIPDENVTGLVVSAGAYASLVSYTKDGIDYRVLLDNSEFIVRKEISVRIEEE